MCSGPTRSVLYNILLSLEPSRVKYVFWVGDVMDRCPRSSTGLRPMDPFVSVAYKPIRHLVLIGGSGRDTSCSPPTVRAHPNEAYKSEILTFRAKHCHGRASGPFLLGSGSRVLCRRRNKMGAGGGVSGCLVEGDSVTTGNQLHQVRSAARVYYAPQRPER